MVGLKQEPNKIIRAACSVKCRRFRIGRKPVTLVTYAYFPRNFEFQTVGLSHGALPGSKRQYEGKDGKSEYIYFFSHWNKNKYGLKLFQRFKLE